MPLPQAIFTYNFLESAKNTKKPQMQFWGSSHQVQPIWWFFFSLWEILKKSHYCNGIFFLRDVIVCHQSGTGGFKKDIVDARNWCLKDNDIMVEIAGKWDSVCIVYKVHSTLLKNKCTQMYETGKKWPEKKRSYDDWGCQGGHMLWSMRTTESLLQKKNVFFMYHYILHLWKRFSP